MNPAPATPEKISDAPRPVTAPIETPTKPTTLVLNVPAHGAGVASEIFLLAIIFLLARILYTLQTIDNESDR